MAYTSTFDVIANDRSTIWPRYRRLDDGRAEALVVVARDGRDTRILREDGVDPVEVTPTTRAEIEALVGSSDVDVPDQPGIARLAVPAGAAVTYRIARGTDMPAADPYNRDSAGELASVLTHPDAPRDGVGGLDLWAPRSADDATGLPPVRLRIPREALDRRVVVRMTRPAPADGGPTSVPVIVLLDGDDWIHIHDAAAAFDRACSAGHVGPHVLVCVPAPGDETARARELTGSAIGPAVVGPILDAVDEALAADGARRGRTVVAGQSLSGVAAVRSAFAAEPHRIDAVVAQSPSFWWPAPTDGHPLSGPPGGAVLDEIADIATSVAFRFTVGTAEPAMAPHVAAVTDALRRSGVDATWREVDGGHDHAVWRTALLTDVAGVLAAD